VRVGDGKRFVIPAGRAVVLPARNGARYLLEGAGEAEVMRVSTPEQVQ
jgi:hypothetical protein